MNFIPVLHSPKHFSIFNGYASYRNLSYIRRIMLHNIINMRLYLIQDVVYLNTGVRRIDAERSNRSN